MSFLGKPLGFAIYYIYKVVPNYAVSIIIFTIILRIILIPLQIKSQKSMAISSAYQPYINEINKKYSKNISKRTEEIQKFQQEHGINPAAGCLTSLIPLLVLFGILDVIYNPLVHMLHLSPNIIDSAVNILKSNSSNIPSNGVQLNLITDVINNPSKYSSLGKDVVDSIRSINLDFLGFNIGDIATMTSFSIIFPLLSLIFSFIQIYISFKTNSMPNVNGSGAMKIFMFAMPLFSLWVSLSVPIGVSLYWIVGSFMQIFQTLILNRICNVNELKKEVTLKIEESKKRKNKKVSSVESELEGSEKISLARKALSEKYDE